MIKPGMYLGQLTDIKIGTSSKGKPVIALHFVIIQEAQGEEVKNIETTFDRTVFYYMSDAAWLFTEEKLRKLEFNGEFTNPRVADKYYDPGAWLICTHDKNYEKWDIAEVSGGKVELKELDKKQLKLLETKFKQNQKLKAPPSLKDIPPPPMPTDDIPF